jgi:cyclopropane-fatty-acyl-phospholipid synthase
MQDSAGADTEARPARHDGVHWFVRRLGSLGCGRLTVEAPDGRSHTLRGRSAGPSAILTLRRPLRLAGRVLSRADVGFAEGYLAGDWDSPDLPSLLSLLALNERTLLPSPASLGNRLLRRLRHRMRANTRRGSRRNVAYHYDLGNDFYRLWLDQTLTYSCALFDTPDEPLAEAQRRKYRALLDLVEARPGEHLLEIGCGWGGFALEAAGRGLEVSGITLSAAQLALAEERVRTAGREARIGLRRQDYRDLTGQYDRVVSIEMFEAVGERYWPLYFDILRRSLKPGGRAALQVITIDEDYYDAYRKEPDFIQIYIFPGGMLPSVRAFNEQARGAGLRIAEQRFYGEHYARTLAHWRRGVRAQTDAIAALGFDRRFLRMWDYYLAYCEAGFRTRRVDLMHVALEAA